jgi:hypothetical protein
MNSNTRKSTENTPPRKKFSEMLDALKSLANTRVAKIKHQEEDSESFNNIMGNVDMNNVKWINMDKNDMHLNLGQDGEKPFQIVYDAARKPIGYIAEAPTPPPKPNNENYYIDSILNSLNSKNMIRQSEKNQLEKLKRPNEFNVKTKRIVIRRVPYKAVDMNPSLLANALGTPEVQETIIDPVKRTVTTISKYPQYNENDIMSAQLRNPFASFFNQYFPIVIHDPFQSYYDSFSNFIEYGEEADICSKAKDHVRQGKDAVSDSQTYESSVTENNPEELKEQETKHIDSHSNEDQSHISRKRRSTYAYFPSKFDKDPYSKSRRVNTKAATKFNIKKPFGHPNRHKLTTSTLNKIKQNKENLVQNSEAPEGYSGTNISTLKVRKGGVAIAGPGGIATAGSGGTAILGAGQSAYTTADGENGRKSGGVAVVGPAHKMISVPDSRESHLLNLPPGAKLLTTGPIVYMNPVDKTSSEDSSSEDLSTETSS